MCFWDLGNIFNCIIEREMTSIKVLVANNVSAGAERVNTRSMEAMLMLNRLCSTGLRTTCYYAVAPFSNC